MALEVKGKRKAVLAKKAAVLGWLHALHGNAVGGLALLLERLVQVAKGLATCALALALGDHLGALGFGHIVLTEGGKPTGNVLLHHECTGLGIPVLARACHAGKLWVHARLHAPAGAVTHKPTAVETVLERVHVPA